MGWVEMVAGAIAGTVVFWIGWWCRGNRSLSSAKPTDAAPFKVGDHVLLNEYDLEPRRVHGVRRESMVGWQVFVKLTNQYAWLPARNVVKAPRETANG